VKKLVSVAVLAATLWVAGPKARASDVGRSQADLPSGFAMFTISNNTNAPITYYLRWGNGPWRSVALPAGYYETHWYALDGAGRAPRPQIRYATLNGNVGVWKYYHLPWSAVYQGMAGTSGSPTPYVFQTNDAGLPDLFAQ
jgi:hypothetical protein